MAGNEETWQAFCMRGMIVSCQLRAAPTRSYSRQGGAYDMLTTWCSL